MFMCTTKCMHDRVGCQKQDKFSGRAEKERVFPETNVPSFYYFKRDITYTY